LQIDLDNVMDSYNYRRMHQGYKLKQNGFRKPTEAHLSETLTFIKGLLAYNWNESEAKRGWKKICLLPMILLKQRTKRRRFWSINWHRILKLGQMKQSKLP